MAFAFPSSSSVLISESRRERERMAKQCELCHLPARMFCESEEASLCWECDAKVHGANFLVARHCRRLLCRSCQAPTPWRASGSRLGSTVSLCSRCCLQGHNGAETGDSGEATRDGGGGGAGGRREGLVAEEIEGGGDMGEEDEDDSSGEDEDEDEDDDEYADAGEDGDNQVVPWSTETDAEAEAATPRPLASCSSSDESSLGGTGVHHGLLKRWREDGDLPSSHWQEDTGCSPSQQGYLRFSSPAAKPEAYPGRMLEEGEAASSYSGCSFRPLTDRTRTVRPRPESAGPSTPPRLPR